MANVICLFMSFRAIVYALCSPNMLYKNNANQSVQKLRHNFSVLSYYEKNSTYWLFPHLILSRWHHTHSSMCCLVLEAHILSDLTTTIAFLNLAVVSNNLFKVRLAFFLFCSWIMVISVRIHEHFIMFMISSQHWITWQNCCVRLW